MIFRELFGGEGIVLENDLRARRETTKPKFVFN